MVFDLTARFLIIVRRRAQFEQGSKESTSEMNTEEEKYLLGLKLIPYFSRRISKVMDAFGSPKCAWDASGKEIMERLGISVDLAEKISVERSKIDLDLELEKISAFGAEILSISDSAYPRSLKEISSPPVLFVKGDLLKTYSDAVAIVGSRKASAYGRAVAFELAKQLADLGVTVVSGVARGIDSAAHRGALSSSGSTIGVLGCGLDVVYPPENRNLYEEISERGSLVSELPLGIDPLPPNFPARNRIISGLTKGTVVVEASERSGALITADFALEQGREVMVVPGNVKSSVSKGCHKLIKEGAYLIDTIDDIVGILQLDLRLPKDALNDDKLKVELSIEEQSILNCLGWESRHIDEIMEAVDYDISKVSSLLTILELKGLVKQDFGHNYLRIQ